MLTSTLECDASSTWPGLLAARVGASGDAVALRRKAFGAWSSRTWRELDAEVMHVAAAFAGRGFEPVDPLLVLGDPGPETIALMHACYRLGGVVVRAERGVAIDPRIGWAPRFAIRSEATPAPASAQFGPQCTWIAADMHGAGRAGDAWMPYSALLAEGVAAARHERADHGAVVASPGAARLTIPRSGGTRPDGASLTREDLVAHARAFIATHGIGRDDDALAPRKLAPESSAVFLTAWLMSGFRLHFGETGDTRNVDRREVAPSLVFESASSYADLCQHVLERLPPVGTSQRRLIDWALESDVGDGKPLRRIAREWLVRRPVRRVLGLARARRCVLDGGPPPLATSTFYAGLGFALRPWVGDVTEPEVTASGSLGFPAPPRHGRRRGIDRIDPAEGEVT